jgi:SAM-dependent methyltransferase
MSHPERLAVRACLALDDVLRKVLRPEQPADIHSESYEETYYAHRLSEGRKFLGRFPSLAGLDILELGCGYGAMLAAFAEEGAKSVGVDIDERRVNFAKHHGQPALTARAEDLPFEDETFDAVVCDETIEHLGDLDAALGEVRRVLRPGGRLYGIWGPAWLSYNGPHLIKVLAIPWVHLLFSDRTIVEALKARKEQRRWPASNIDARIEDFLRMGKVTRRKLRFAARNAGFVIEREESHSPRRIKHMLSRVPPFDELLAGELTVILQRPPRGLPPTE